MKTFKEIRKTAQPKLVSFDSSFAELRAKKKLDMIGWDSSFAELRAKKKPLKEAAAVNTDINSSITKHIHKDAHNASGVGLPKHLENDHIDSIAKFTASAAGNISSSKNLNSYLRNRAGEKKQKIHYDHDHTSAEKAVKALSSAFTRKNTNKKPIVSFGGVPQHVGEFFLKQKKGSQHSLAGFTSTSSDPGIAHEFARNYPLPKSANTHIIRYHVHPGASLSTHFEGNSQNPLSSYEKEKEMILNHGAHVTYHGSEKVDSFNGRPTYIHHLEVHPHRTELHEYPTKYEE